MVKYIVDDNLMQLQNVPNGWTNVEKATTLILALDNALEILPTSQTKIIKYTDICIENNSI